MRGLAGGVVAVVGVAVVAGCDSTGGGSAVTGTIAAEDFGAEFAEKYCGEWEDCNVYDPCPTSEAQAGSSAGCAGYDESVAYDCVHGSYSCDTSHPALPFVSIPDACCQICGGSTDCVTTVTYGY